MIKKEERYSSGNDVLIDLYDTRGYICMNVYTDKFGESVLHIDRNNDTLKICDLKQHEIQKSLMFLLNREDNYYENDI